MESGLETVTSLSCMAGAAGGGVRVPRRAAARLGHSVGCWLYICIYIYMYVYMYTYSLHMCIYEYMNMHIDTYIYEYVCIYISMYIYLCI
jgi:hypothetical protein